MLFLTPLVLAHEIAALVLVLHVGQSQGCPILLQEEGGHLPENFSSGNY